MYNILQKLRTASFSPGLARGNASNATDAPIPQSTSPIHSAQFSLKEKLIHDHGLVSILQQLHDELDAAVADIRDMQQQATSKKRLDNLFHSLLHRAFCGEL